MSGETVTSDATVRDATLQVLAEHRIECAGPEGVTCRGCRDAGWMPLRAFNAHVADVLAAAGLLRPDTTVDDREALRAALGAGSPDNVIAAILRAGFSRGPVSSDDDEIPAEEPIYGLGQETLDRIAMVHRFTPKVPEFPVVVEDDDPDVEEREALAGLLAFIPDGDRCGFTTHLSLDDRRAVADAVRAAGFTRPRGPVTETPAVTSEQVEAAAAAIYELDPLPNCGDGSWAALLKRGTEEDMGGSIAASIAADRCESARAALDAAMGIEVRTGEPRG